MSLSGVWVGLLPLIPFNGRLGLLFVPLRMKKREMLGFKLGLFNERRVWELNHSVHVEPPGLGGSPIQLLVRVACGRFNYPVL